jgi:hypothetical protein
MAGKAKDDLSAVREISELLEGFGNDERERIIRWVREKLGMAAGPAAATTPAAIATHTQPAPAAAATPAGPAAALTVTDMRNFVAQKNPKNDKQLAAVVAYYYRFVAPQDQRKDSIGSEELTNACRIADRDRPKKPAQTLVNAFRDGFLDRAERGAYRLNTVGENLVAMVLPDGNANTDGRRNSSKRGTPRKALKSSRKKRSKK